MACAVPVLRGAAEVTDLIVGGGVAGAAAACLLGPGATLVEREAAPHDKVCGEFVSWEAQAALAKLGLDVAALGGAAIREVRLAHRAHLVVQELPGCGLGLSRRQLDAALLDLAESRGARVLRGHAVRHLVEGGAEVEGLGRIAARRVLLATGKHDLRGCRRAVRPGDLVGLKMHYRLAPGQARAVAGAVEIILFPGGYAGLQPIEDGKANLCLLIRRDAFAAAGSGWAGVVAHLRRSSVHLEARLEGAEELFGRPVAIFGVPYGFVHGGGDPAGVLGRGVLRLGDQMGVIPSFSGDGIAIALHTAFAAVGAGVGDAAGYHGRMRGELSGQIGRAMVLHRMGQAAPGLVTAAARVWPGAMAWVARLTRVRQELAWQS